jgi:hypothetical protein
VGAFEHYRRVRGAAAMELSRLFVYYTGRRAGGRLHEDKGVRVAEVMGALIACGAPDEKMWPYVPEKVNTEPPADVFAWAFQTRPTQFASVSQGDGVRGALAGGFPVVVNLSVGARTYEEAARTGVLRPPTAEELKAGGFAHALLIVGYDMDREEYTLRNSWGTTWGDQGYCRASFATIDRHGWPDEYWILGNLDELDARPGEQAPGATAAPAPPSPTSVAGLAAKMRDDIRSSLTKDIADAAKDIRERMKPKPPGQN